MKNIRPYGAWLFLGLALLVSLWAGFLVLRLRSVAAQPFEATGQFGDSFGVVSALMTGLAAYFAYRAFIQARAQASEAAAAQQTRDDELTFFRLLSTRREIVEAFDFGGMRGLSAATKLANALREEAARNMTRDAWATRLPDLYRTHITDSEGREHLWHYFRFTYHILLFIKTRFHDPDKAYEYARMLRAELSEAEQVLIALNGLYFEGDNDKKLKPLIETFALLHNISDSAKAAFLLEGEEAYTKDAFERRTAGTTRVESVSVPPNLRHPLPTTGRGWSLQLVWRRWTNPGI